MNKTEIHFKQLLKLIELEQEEEKRLLAEIIGRHSIQDRVTRGLTWYPLSIHDWYFDRAERLVVEVERVRNHDTPHEFNTGRLVSIFSNREGADDTNEETGVITSIRGNQAKVVLKCDEVPEWLRLGKAGMDLLYDETSFREMKRAVVDLMKVERGRPKELLEALIGEREPVFGKEENTEANHLNESQNEALHKALAARDVAIVHGPPGTGKTTTLIEIIKKTLDTNNQVLVCAPSNNAVDLLVEKLTGEKIKALRIGNPARINSHIQEHTLSQKITQHADFSLIKKMKKQSQELRNMASKYKRSFGHAERQQRKALYDEAWKLRKDAFEIEDYITSDLIESAQVIACTLVGSANQAIKDRRYPVCIIDEASQALEPATWIPILRSDKVIMAGDHQQLPPTVKSFEAARQGLSTSLFEMCMNQLDVDVMLSTQYRMNEKIMAFSSQEFYDDALEAHPTVANHTLGEVGLPVIEFLDTAGCGFDEESARKDSKSTGSLQNSHEADLLLKHLYGLYEGLENEKVNWKNLSCGIISPYKGQVELLKGLIGDFPYKSNRLAVNTVDGFQGQERDIIYISLVRSNDRNEIGFLKDYRRMNVAITRARKKLVIVGDSATIGNDSFYSSFISYAENIDGYKSAWELLYQ